MENNPNIFSGFQRAKEGFTLIELSIVLVIIGLLVGGVLASQTLLNSARVKRQIQQFEQLDVALQSFKLKFDRLPGDPDKNSVIGDDVFNELSTMGGLTGDYIPAASLGATDNVFGMGAYAPYAEVGRGGIMTGQNAHHEILWMLSGARGCKKQNWAGFGGSGSSTCALDALSPDQAVSIDAKTDDANPYSGAFAVVLNDCDHSFVTGVGAAGADPQMTYPNEYAFAFRQDCQDCLSSNQYNLAGDNHHCAVQVKATNQF